MKTKFIIAYGSPCRLCTPECLKIKFEIVLKVFCALFNNSRANERLYFVHVRFVSFRQTSCFRFILFLTPIFCFTNRIPALYSFILIRSFA